MSYELTVEKHKDYLHATVTGENTRDNVFAYMQEIVSECNRRCCFRVLIEERLEGPRFSPMEIFDMVSEGSLNALGFFEMIAYVDEQMGKTLDFAETVAVNRGLPITTFESVDAARAWMEQRHNGASERDAHWDDAADSD